MRGAWGREGFGSCWCIRVGLGAGRVTIRCLFLQGSRDTQQLNSQSDPIARRCSDFHLFTKNSILPPRPLHFYEAWAPPETVWTWVEVADNSDQNFQEFSRWSIWWWIRWSDPRNNIRMKIKRWSHRVHWEGQFFFILVLKRFNWWSCRLSTSFLSCSRSSNRRVSRHWRWSERSTLFKMKTTFIWDKLK